MIRLLLALSLVFAGGGVVSADPLKDTVSSVSVVGEAFEEVAPDRATLHFGVVTERPTAGAAAAENARAVDSVITELKAMGVADAEIQTRGVTLAPVTIEERDAKGKPKGAQQLFRARNDLTARIMPAAKAGEIMGRLIDRGVNSFEGVEYDYSNTAGKLDALRAAAVKDAERRAHAYAEAAGLRLARILEIHTADEDVPAPRPYMQRMTAAEAVPPVPLQPGLQRISARVSVSWALSR